MAASLSAFEPADYAIIAASGLTAGLALLACAYTVPWQCCARTSGGGGGSSSSPPKHAAAQPPTRGFNVLWHGRAALSLLSAAWALSLLLRVSSLWGANSFLLPAGVRAWTGSGWMCRIYLTASLGVLHPLCAFTTLLMLTAALSRRHRPETLRHPNARLLGQALLCTLPVAAVQGVIAWLGLAVQYQGQQVEASPRSLPGYFFATYWQGTPQQCSSGSSSGSGSNIGSSSSSGGPGGAAAGAGDTAAAAPAAAGGPDGGGIGGGDCTLCVFPAAAAIAHVLFAAAFLAVLCLTCSRLAAAVLNQRLKRRMRAFQAAYSLLLLIGAAAVGASVAWGPFTWANQACWLVFVASSLLTLLLVEWEVVVWPVRDLRVVDKRLVLWADALAAATAEQALDGRTSTGSPLGGFGGPAGGSSLIKAHGRSAEAEAYVHAAAAARTMSVSSMQLPSPAPLPSPQRLPPPPPPLASPQRLHPPPLPSPLRGPPHRTQSLSSVAAMRPPPTMSSSASAWSPQRPQPPPGLQLPALSQPGLPVTGLSVSTAAAAAGGPLPPAPIYTPASPTRPTPKRELVFP